MKRVVVFLFVQVAAAACARTPVVPPSPPALAERSSARASPLRETEVEVETSTDAAFLEDLPFDADPKSGSATEPGRGPGTTVVTPVLTQTGTISFDIPMVEDERVAFWEDYLLGRGRGWFATWLSRSTRYVPIFREALGRRGLPEDLVFLSMVESGFSTSAQSWADAVGPWQFVESTGRAYGLRIDFWVDERRDFERSTEAALTYLNRLHDRFGNWLLAFAAYNAGPGRVAYAIRRAGVEDFWRLDRWLRKETENYVPKILAAARVAKRADRLGFQDVDYLPPFDFRTVTATRAVSLRTLAEACPEEMDEEELSLLNPALRARVTPPGETWALRVPRSTTATCAAALDESPQRERWAYRWHPVAEDDTLERVAARYHTTAQAILEFSDAEPEDFFKFEEIVVPIPRAKVTAAIRTPTVLARRSAVYGVPSVRIVRYRVRGGDSLWSIAQRFHVSVSDLCRWNGLRRDGILSLGRRLRIEQRPGGRRAGSARTTTARTRSDGRHVVRAGESFWSIARRYDTTVDRLLELNRLDGDHVLMPGDELRIR